MQWTEQLKLSCLTVCVIQARVCKYHLTGSSKITTESVKLIYITNNIMLMWTTSKFLWHRAPFHDTAGDRMLPRWHSKDTASHVSVKSTAAEVVGNDDVSDGIKDELNVGGVGGACLVTVDLFHWAPILRLKLCLDVRSSLFVCRRSCEISNQTVSCKS